MEHIITSNLARHLNGNDILYGLQHGFREKRSCETQLIELVEELGRELLILYHSADYISFPLGSLGPWWIL